MIEIVIALSALLFLVMIHALDVITHNLMLHFWTDTVIEFPWIDRFMWRWVVGRWHGLAGWLIGFTMFGAGCVVDQGTAVITGVIAKIVSVTMWIAGSLTQS